jgi:hypothetical protein
MGHCLGREFRMADWMCDKHQQERSGMCEWCSRPLCAGCIEEAYGKKYCFRCVTNLPVDKLGTTNESLSRRGRQNVDPSLSHADVEERRKFVEMKISSDRDLYKGVKSQAQEQEVKDLRKKREEFEKMRKKFNL